MNVQPSYFRTDTHYWNTFGNNETEVSARWLVRFCQDRGDWGPFPLVHLQAFYEAARRKPEQFHFNRLTADGYYHHSAGGGHWVTQDPVVTVKDGTVTILPGFIGKLLQNADLAA